MNKYMLDLTWREAKSRYWHFDPRGVIVEVLGTIGITYFIYRKFDPKDAILYVLPVIIFGVIFVLIGIIGFVVMLIKRMFWVGYLDFWIYDSLNGVVSSNNDDYVCVYVQSGESSADLNFIQCYGRFSKLQRIGERQRLDLSNAGNISWAGVRKPSPSFEYGEIPRGNNVLHFARIDKKIHKIVFFTIDNELVSFGPGVFDVDVLLGGMCKELKMGIRPRIFKGRVFFEKNDSARLEYR